MSVPLHRFLIIFKVGERGVELFQEAIRYCLPTVGPDVQNFSCKFDPTHPAWHDQAKSDSSSEFIPSSSWQDARHLCVSVWSR